MLPIVNVCFKTETASSLRDKIGDMLGEESMDFYMELNDIKFYNEPDIDDIIGVARKYVDLVFEDFDVELRYDKSDSMDLAELLAHLYDIGYGENIHDIAILLEEAKTFDCKIEIRIKKGK